VRGIEIDAGLASLSQTLLKSMLAREFGFDAGKLGEIVRRADALSHPIRKKFDLVIGNPPFGKVGRGYKGAMLQRAGLANIGGHTNVYSLFLLRSLSWVRPGGGLVFVLPTSFVAGPYFSGLRQEVLKRAEVLRIDLHEQRDNLFLGAVQDICLLTLRRRESDAHSPAKSPYELGIIDADGNRTTHGHGQAEGSGEPWILPVASRVHAFPLPLDKVEETTLFSWTDYGFRIRVGKVVPTRERKRLHKHRKAGDLPLVWASVIRPNGTFDFDAPRKFGNKQWYGPPESGRIRYATTKPAVLVQRTSNRDQRRILNAAPVPRTFRKKHARGFVTENHVIVIEAERAKPLLPPSTLAALLNSAVINQRFSAVAGSFSVSAKLLQRLALPHPALIKGLRKETFEQGLWQLFEGLETLLIPSQLSSNTEHAIDKTRDLRSRAPIDKDPRLKRRAVA
jgi:adenine-specific DNA-methyltransferase